MASRPRAADDFDFIGKRLREIQQKTQPINVEALIADSKALTREECAVVANMYHCRWPDSNERGCGRHTSKACLKANECMFGKERE